MGIEYKLRFIPSSAESIAFSLRQLPGAVQLSAHAGRFEFRSERTTGSMPDAMAAIEADGLYFCDNGGAGKQFLGVVIARLVSEFGLVIVSEWE